MRSFPLMVAGMDIGMKERIEEAIRHTTAAFPLGGIELRTESQPIALRNVATTCLRYLKPGSNILDVGCGTCHKAAVLQSLGFRLSAFDNLQDAKPGEIEPITSFAEKFGIDFKQISGGGGGLPYEKSSFDMVMMHHVLEHLHDSPRVFLNELLELTKPGGLLFVTVPNAGNVRKRLHLLFGKTNMPPFESFYWSPGPWTGHVREYVLDDLTQLSKYLDLEVLELRGIDDLISLKLPSPSIMRSGYLLVTSVFRGWKDTWQLVGKKNSGQPPESGEQDRARSGKTAARSSRNRELNAV